MKKAIQQSLVRKETKRRRKKKKAIGSQPLYAVTDIGPLQVIVAVLDRVA